MGLPDSSRSITIVIVGVMMAIRWLEAHVRENNRQEAPTREQLQKLDCLKDLDLFETMCKILNIPMEVKKIWVRRRLMPWFRANMTAWLYEYAKKHMSEHGRVYSGYQLDIGAGVFKRAFVTHRNAVTTAVKRISRTSERSGKEKEEMLKEDLERNVMLCLHNSFCRNRESNVDPLPCCKQRVEEQKCWRTASNSVRIANNVLQDTETESAESVSQEELMEHWKMVEKSKTQKERKLEEFRSFRTSKRRKEKKQRNDEKEEVKTQNCFMCVKKTQVRNQATKL